MSEKESFLQRSSLRRKFFILFFTTAILVPMLAGGINIFQFSQKISNIVKNDLVLNNRAIGDTISSFLHGLTTDLKFYAGQSGIREGLFKSKDYATISELNKLVQSNKSISAIFIANSSGEIKNINNRSFDGKSLNTYSLMGSSVKKWDYDLKSFQEQEYVDWLGQCLKSTPEKPIITDKIRRNLTLEKIGFYGYNIILALPLRISGANYGCLAMVLDASTLGQVFTRRLMEIRKNKLSFEAIIMDANGMIVWESSAENASAFKENLAEVKVQSVLKWQGNGNAEVLMDEMNVRKKKEVITSISSLRGFYDLGWGVITRVDKKEISSPVFQSLIWPSITLGISTILLIFVLIYVMKRFSTTIDKSLTSIQKLGEGDYSENIQIESEDEIGKLQYYLKNTIMNLRQLATEILNTRMYAENISNDTAKKVKEILYSSQEQSALLEEAAAAIEELSASTNSIQEAAQKQVNGAGTNAKSMSNLKETFIRSEEIQTTIMSGANKVAERAQAGGQSIQNSVRSMEEISETSQKILGIIDVINDIADQTDLLALNASIEAARAGEHGKGFAVVAHEISELAEKSSQSSKEIARLLRAANEKVEVGTEQVTGTRAIFQEIIDSMSNLVANINKVSELDKHIREEVNETARRAHNVAVLAKEIAEATHLQNQSAEEITDDMSKANMITSTNAEQIANLNEMLQELSKVHQKGLDLVKNFKLHEQENEKKLDL